MGNVYLNIFYHSLFFLGRVEMKREFHSRTKAFACLLTMCAGFSDAYTFICRGGTLAAGQTGNVIFLSVGLIGHQISDVEVKLATMLSFMLGIFLITVEYPSALYPHNFGDGIFASIGKKCLHRAFFWPEFRNRSDLIWRSR